jgi:ATP-dependent Zn protease
MPWRSFGSSRHDRVVKTTTIIRHGRALGLSATKPSRRNPHPGRLRRFLQTSRWLWRRALQRRCSSTPRPAGPPWISEQATELASAYIGLYGMGGTLYSYTALAERSPSPDLRRRINCLLEHQKEQVARLLADHADLVHVIAEQLLACDELTGDELLRLAEHYPPLSGNAEPPPIEESIYPERDQVAVSTDEEELDDMVPVELPPTPSSEPDESVYGYLA